ncbi:hypothetical protein HPB50_006341 [Hyalomma asiaticum]|uniref:Uncharacterized protein n=1 Tax=Hyalomma asiaticum TaxID=266040 RepID=A0ACB7S155_HYAAI|nr:hypothetical protein HPB50_006341 [Hyalomma asiaticum]
MLTTAGKGGASSCGDDIRRGGMDGETTVVHVEARSMGTFETTRQEEEKSKEGSATRGISEGHPHNARRSAGRVFSLFASPACYWPPPPFRFALSSFLAFPSFP